MGLFLLRPLRCGSLPPRPAYLAPWPRGLSRSQTVAPAQYTAFCEHTIKDKRKIHYLRNLFLTDGQSTFFENFSININIKLDTEYKNFMLHAKPLRYRLKLQLVINIIHVLDQLLNENN